MSVLFSSSFFLYQSSLCCAMLFGSCYLQCRMRAAPIFGCGVSFLEPPHRHAWICGIFWMFFFPFGFLEFCLTNYTPMGRRPCTNDIGMSILGQTAATMPFIWSLRSGVLSASGEISGLLWVSWVSVGILPHDYTLPGNFGEICGWP